MPQGRLVFWFASEPWPGQDSTSGEQCSVSLQSKTAPYLVGFHPTPSTHNTASRARVRFFTASTPENLSGDDAGSRWDPIDVEQTGLKRATNAPYRDEKRQCPTAGVVRAHHRSSRTCCCWRSSRLSPDKRPGEEIEDDGDDRTDGLDREHRPNSGVRRMNTTLGGENGDDKRLWPKYQRHGHVTHGWQTGVLPSHNSSLNVDHFLHLACRFAMRPIIKPMGQIYAVLGPSMQSRHRCSHTMYLTNSIDTNGLASKKEYLLLHHGDERRLVASAKSYQARLLSYRRTRLTSTGF